VDAAVARLRRKGKPIVPGRVVAELTFGFWTNLLDVRYERGQILWPTLLSATFPHLRTVQRTRRIVAKRFKAIGWLCPELLRVARATDQFPTVYKLGWRVYREPLSMQ
jgi:hypothetical protein